MTHTGCYITRSKSGYIRDLCVNTAHSHEWLNKTDELRVFESVPLSGSTFSLHNVVRIPLHMKELLVF